METTQLDQKTLQDLLGGASGGGIALPESLTNILTTALMASVGLMVVFLILYGLSIVRKWKVQSAVLHMQKDVAEIKQALMKESVESLESPRAEARKVEVTANDETIV